MSIEQVIGMIQVAALAIQMIDSLYLKKISLLLFRIIKNK
jgi:hypothetical protein